MAVLMRTSCVFQAISTPLLYGAISVKDTPRAESLFRTLLENDTAASCVWQLWIYDVDIYHIILQRLLLDKEVNIQFIPAASVMSLLYRLPNLKSLRLEPVIGDTKYGLCRPISDAVLGDQSKPFPFTLNYLWTSLDVDEILI